MINMRDTKKTQPGNEWKYTYESMLAKLDEYQRSLEAITYGHDAILTTAGEMILLVQRNQAGQITVKLRLTAAGAALNFCSYAWYAQLDKLRDLTAVACGWLMQS